MLVEILLLVPTGQAPLAARVAAAEVTRPATQIQEPPSPNAATGSLSGQIVFLSTRDFPQKQNALLGPFEIYAMNPDGTNQRRITQDLELSNLSAPVVSPDGTRIIVGGYDSVRILSADGIVIETLAGPTKAGWALDWSVSDQVLYAAFGEMGEWEELYSLDIETGTFTRLTNDNVRQLYATWSSDGKQIAYMHDYVLWLMDADGENKRLLIPGEARDMDWSPDGKQVVFESLEVPKSGVEYDLWVVNADGTAKQRLVDMPGTPLMGPTWSPDGTQIAFSTWFDPPSDNHQIAVVDVKTGETRQLTQEGANVEPYWVPSAAPAASAMENLSSKIIFLSDRELDTRPEGMHMGPHDLYAMNSDGGDQSRLSRNLPYFTGEQAALSPDVQELAVGSSRCAEMVEGFCRKQQGQITFYSLSGDLLRTLDTPGRAAWVNSWPSDKTMLVSYQRDDNRRALYIIDPTSGEARQLADYTLNSWFGAVTPDGQTIAFDTDPDFWTETAQVWIMDATGENRRLLVDRSGYMMAWSPDGTQLAFESDTPTETSSTQYDIWIVNADGSNLRNLTQGRFERHYGPSWSPDGKQIVFWAKPGGSPTTGQVYVADVGTGEVEQLTSEGDNWVLWWIGSTAQDTVPQNETGPEPFGQKQASIERPAEPPIEHLDDLATFSPGSGQDKETSVEQEPTSEARVADLAGTEVSQLPSQQSLERGAEQAYDLLGLMPLIIAVLLGIAAVGSTLLLYGRQRSSK